MSFILPIFFLSAAFTALSAASDTSASIPKAQLIFERDSPIKISGGVFIETVIPTKFKHVTMKIFELVTDIHKVKVFSDSEGMMKLLLDKENIELLWTCRRKVWDLIRSGDNFTIEAAKVVDEEVNELFRNSKFSPYFRTDFGKWIFPD